MGRILSQECVDKFSYEVMPATSDGFTCGLIWVDRILRTKNATVACVAPVAAPRPKEGRLIYTMGVVSSLATLHCT